MHPRNWFKRKYRIPLWSSGSNPLTFDPTFDKPACKPLFVMSLCGHELCRLPRLLNLQAGGTTLPVYGSRGREFNN